MPLHHPDTTASTRARSTQRPSDPGRERAARTGRRASGKSWLVPQDRAVALHERDGTASGLGVDLEAEGLLDGVHGPARIARERLLRELLEDGMTLEELRDAVVKDRIALVPSERLLQSGDRHVQR